MQRCPLDDSTEPGRWWAQHHLSWKVAEERLFTEFRRRSDEAFILPAAIERSLAGWYGILASKTTIIDLGASEGGLLSSQLRGRFGGYMSVPFDGRWAYDGPIDPPIPQPDSSSVVAAVHVVQYMARPDLVLGSLADGIAVVVMLDTQGDQHRTWELALDYAPGYPYHYDQADVFRDWLMASSIKFEETPVWSAAVIDGDVSLRNTVAFFLGTEQEELVHYVATAFRGRRRLTTAHRVFTFRLAQTKVS